MFQRVLLSSNAHCLNLSKNLAFILLVLVVYVVSYLLMCYMTQKRVCVCVCRGERVCVSLFGS